MKRRIAKKNPRVVYYGHQIFRTKCAEYIQPVPYDKRKKEIPSSVNCFFNTEYFTLREALSTMLTI
jgi:hypothetical protein